MKEFKSIVCIIIALLIFAYSYSSITGTVKPVHVEFIDDIAYMYEEQCMINRVLSYNICTEKDIILIQR